MANAPSDCSCLTRPASTRSSLTDLDRSADPSSYLATFGAYEVDDDRRTFILTPQGAADRHLIGTEVLRHVTFDGDLAIFNTPTSQVDGFDVTTYITWRRVTPT